jgi:hypothetical protein
MDHISVDAAFMQRPTEFHPSIPAPPGGYLLVNSPWWEGR